MAQMIQRPGRNKGILLAIPRSRQPDLQFPKKEETTAEGTVKYIVFLVKSFGDLVIIKSPLGRIRSHFVCLRLLPVADFLWFGFTSAHETFERWHIRFCWQWAERGGIRATFCCCSARGCYSGVGPHDNVLIKTCKWEKDILLFLNSLSFNWKHSESPHIHGLTSNNAAALYGISISSI